MLDFDLNEPLMEEENDEQDDEPFIGQTFESEDEAFVFYTIMQNNMDLLFEKIDPIQEMEELLGVIFYAIVQENNV
ncbi:hypothetical protein V6N13_074561 [Hibiscus sabdariffa]